MSKSRKNIEEPFIFKNNDTLKEEIEIIIKNRTSQEIDYK